MREIGIEELRKLELLVLEEIDSICRENGFRYSLIGGSMLGAIRHKGFIPWDDDIDIMMPRSDYNRFVEFCKNNKDINFNFITNETAPEYGYLFGKACLKNTLIIDEVANFNELGMGIFVDVFPADGLGNTVEEAKKKFNSSRFLRELLVARNWKKFSKSKTHAWHYEPIRFAFYVLSRFVTKRSLVKLIEKKHRDADFDKMEYVGVICGSYRAKEIVKKETYCEYTEVPFEDKVFSGLKNYDQYLSGVYGDYMQLPPEEKRVSHHTFKAYYKD